MLSRKTLSILLLMAGLAAPAQSIPEKFIGDWSSTECWKNLSDGADCVEYKLHIRKAGDKLVAELEGDGFQTLVRLKASVKRIHDGIEVVCSDDQGSMAPRFKPGLPLFRLLMYRSTVKTTWLAISPVNDKSGAQFVKSGGST